MTLRQLEMFVAIVESGSFSKAATKLYVAQPSLSQQIRNLEEELGERLLFRMRNRKMQLTEAGKIVKHHADNILRQVQIVKMDVATLTTDPSGEIHIGIGGHQFTSMLAPALHSFHSSFPKIRVDIVNGTTPRIVELLKNNALDLGIITVPLATEGLRAENLFSEELVVVVGNSRRYERKQRLTAAEIAALPLVLYDKATGTRARIDKFFHDAGIAPNIVLELSSVEAMVNMVEAGFGATIVPASALVAGAVRRKFRAFGIEGKPLIRNVGLAAAQFPRLPRVIEQMVQLIRDCFRDVSSKIA